MPLDDYIVYWTDNLNPPRRLVLGSSVTEATFPYPQLRQDVLDEYPDFDLAATNIYKFSGTYTYGLGSGFALASTGGGAVFSHLPRGTRIFYQLGTARFSRRGMRSHIDYAVGAGSTFDATQFVGFAYNLCNTAAGAAADGILSRVIGGFGSHVIQGLGEGGAPTFIGITITRTGQFIFYFPCRWWGPQGPTFKTVRVEGIISLPRNVGYVNESNRPIRVSLQWPPPEEL